MLWNLNKITCVFAGIFQSYIYSYKCHNEYTETFHPPCIAFLWLFKIKFFNTLITSEFFHCHWMWLNISWELPFSFCFFTTEITSLEHSPLVNIFNIQKSQILLHLSFTSLHSNLLQTKLLLVVTNNTVTYIHEYDKNIFFTLLCGKIGLQKGKTSNKFSICDKYSIPCHKK